MKKHKILVIGSSNIDMIAKVENLPVSGETVGGAMFVQNFGGKGANQAVAAARLGGSVEFITSLGNDSFASELQNHFINEDISIKHSLLSKTIHTGVALIFVDSKANNCIAVAPGANGELSTESIKDIDTIFDGVEIVVAQAEIPIKTVEDVMKKAKEKGIKTLFNPAPAFKISKEFISNIDILVVNEVEASVVSGVPFDINNLHSAAMSLRAMGANDVVITLGEEGVYALCGEKEIRLPAYKVDAVDTTAAGDTFCGALSTICASESLSEEALKFASASSALAVTKLGAQQSIPSYNDVMEFMKNNSL